MRAFGSLEQMQRLLGTAIKTWGELPGGKEIETLFDSMFPRQVELEVTPLIDKTQPA
jgi:hypothetical protein